jgi:hypothetical protein
MKRKKKSCKVGPKEEIPGGILDKERSHELILSHYASFPLLSPQRGLRGDEYDPHITPNSNYFYPSSDSGNKNNLILHTASMHPSYFENIHRNIIPLMPICV